MKLAAVITTEGKYCTKRLTREFSLSAPCRRDERNIMPRETHLPEHAVSNCTAALSRTQAAPFSPPSSSTNICTRQQESTPGIAWMANSGLILNTSRQASFTESKSLCFIQAWSLLSLQFAATHLAFSCSLHQDPPLPGKSISVLPQSFSLKRFNSPRFVYDCC